MSRPRFKITADHIRLIETAAGYGLTEAAIARLVGCSPETFYRRKGIRPDILTALERGKALAALNVGKALYTKAIKGDVPAITWYEKTRQNRSEISRLEHSGPDGSPISISTLSPAERKKRVEAIMGAALARRATIATNGHNGNGNGHHP